MGHISAKTNKIKALENRIKILEKRLDGLVKQLNHFLKNKELKQSLLEDPSSSKEKGRVSEDWYSNHGHGD